MFDVFHERANDLSSARRRLAEDAKCPSALALLSIHSAISWNDAVLVRLSGKPVQGKDHKQAARVLEKHCSSRKLNGDGVKHLEKLLSQKSNVAYGDKQITADEARFLSTKAERFENWALQTIRRIP